MKAAIVGCGSIAHVHAKSILNLGHELVALADISPDSALDFSKEFGGKVYTSLEEMLSKETIDVLHICTPHVLHTPMAITGLKYGVHVFMEKPPVISFRQLQELQQAVEAENEKPEPHKLGFCFQNRYNPPVIKALEILHSGKAGNVLGARGYVTWSRSEKYYTASLWRGTLSQEGGGALINQSIHTLDLLHLLVGKTPVSVDAFTANHYLKTQIEVEDTVSALITYPDARLSFYATNSYTENPYPLMEIHCENMNLRLEGNSLSCLYPDGSSKHIALEQLKSLGKSYWGVGHTSCIADFYNSITENRPFALELPGVVDTIRLMLKIYESANKQCSISWEEA